VVTLATRAVGAAVGLALDRRFGEPPWEPHPVAAFGSMMQQVEGLLYDGSSARGAVHAAAGVALGAAAGAALPIPVATWLAAAGSALRATADAIGDALAADDLEHARRLLPSLVGRDPEQLDATGIARAVVESVAENTVDAVVAPACWAALAGGPGVLVHRAVNTMDAMVGYRNDRFARYGTASARLDDAMAWVPARVTAGLVAVARPRRAAAVVRSVRRDAPAHPSPNSGVAEAAFAAALGLRLGGPTPYVDGTEGRPWLGDGRPPGPADVAAATRLARDVETAMVVGLLALAAGTGSRGRRRRHAGSR
jgi:adenosylcobinamide-phosphate synthase